MASLLEAQQQTWGRQVVVLKVSGCAPLGPPGTKWQMLVLLLS